MFLRGGKAPSEADEDDYMENVVHRLVRVVFPGWEEADGAMNERSASLSALFPLKLFPVFLSAFPLVEVGGFGVVSCRSVDEVENLAVSVSRLPDVFDDFSGLVGEVLHQHGDKSFLHDFRDIAMVHAVSHGKII